MANLEDRINAVLARIKSNPFGTDLLFSFFVSACLNYRRDSVVRPFPKEYIDDSDQSKNYENLVCMLVLRVYFGKFGIYKDFY